MTPGLVFAKTLRDQRTPLLAWGLGLGVIALVTGVGFARLYPAGPDRAKLAAEVHGGLSTVQVLYGQPHNLQTLGGIIEWRAFGPAPVLFGLFAIFAVTGATRGAEERRTVEVVLATRVGRRQLVAGQMLGIAAALALASVLAGALVLTAGPAAGEGKLSLARTLGAILNLGVAAALFGAVALVTSQLSASRRGAATQAAAALFIAHIWNGLALVVPALEPVRALSPLYLYSRSSPLATGHMDWAALGGLAAMTVVLGAAAFTMYARRDIFGVWRPGVPRPAWLARPERAPSWGPSGPFARGLRDGRGPAAAWAVGLAAYATLLTALAPNIRHALADDSGSELFRRLDDAGLVSEAGILSIGLFSLLPLFVCVSAAVFAAGWAAEETNGRLEAELATSRRRTSVYLSRLAADAALVAAVSTAVFAAMSVTVLAGGVDIPLARVAVACLELVPLGGVVLTFGYAASAIRPGRVVAAGATLLAAAYFADLLLPLLDAPSWTRRLSIFGLYGRPIVDGFGGWPVAALALLAVGLALAGARLFEGRDLAH